MSPVTNCENENTSCLHKRYKTTRKIEVHDPNHGFSDFVLAATHFVNNEFYSPNTES